MSAPDTATGPPALHPYQYVVLRCVPRVDREEFLNVGVLLHCQALDLLAVRWHVDERRLGAAFPGLDLAMLCRSLEFVDAVCAGTEAAGAAAGHTLSARFGFLKAPRSTIVQPGPVHGGISAEPRADLDRLLSALIAPSPD